MWLLEKLDRQDTALQKSNWIAEQQSKTAVENVRWGIGGDLYEAYQHESIQHKQYKVEKLSFFAAISQFIKNKTEKQDVHTNGFETDRWQSNITEPSQSQSVLTM